MMRPLVSMRAIRNPAWLVGTSSNSGSMMALRVAGTSGKPLAWKSARPIVPNSLVRAMPLLLSSNILRASGLRMPGQSGRGGKSSDPFRIARSNSFSSFFEILLNGICCIRAFAPMMLKSVFVPEPAVYMP